VRVLAPRWWGINLTFVGISGLLLLASSFPWISVRGGWMAYSVDDPVFYEGSPWGGVLVAIVAAALAVAAMVFRLPILSCAVMFAGGVGGLFAAADYVRAELGQYGQHPTVWLQLACVACAGLAVGGLGAIIEYRRLLLRTRDSDPG
jgi:hypothetical protein